jgi:predicted PurR-regulated permease PerM
MITAILSGALMFIPELGAPLAMLAPAIASVLQGSDATIPIIIIMLAFQQVLLRFIIPKFMSEALGMPPLLILVSVLVSAKIMGFWGFLFGIPVAGAIYTITIVSLEQIKQNADAQFQQRMAEGDTQQPLDSHE